MLQVSHLNKSYSNSVTVYPVLKDVSLHIKRGEFVAVMGAVRQRQDDAVKLYLLLYPA